jgi:hypothetical protein
MRALVTTILVLVAPTGAALAGPVALSGAQADRVTAGLFPGFDPAFFLDASLPQSADGAAPGGSSSDGSGGAVAEVSITPSGAVVAESSARDGVAQAFARQVVITSR